MAKAIPNKHKVPAKQWKRWSDRARAIFNEVFATMVEQGIFLHPKATPAAREHWKTTRWNAAWVAADAADGFRTVAA
jgi:hypothetical protein